MPRHTNTTGQSTAPALTGDVYKRQGIDGWVALKDPAIDMDLKLNTNEVGFKEILSLIPAIYAKDFEGLKTEGIATLSADIKGTMVGDSIVPQFNVAMTVKDAMFRYPSLPAGVDQININAEIKKDVYKRQVILLSSVYNYSLLVAVVSLQ